MKKQFQQKVCESEVEKKSGKCQRGFGGGWRENLYKKLFQEMKYTCMNVSITVY